MSLEYIRTYYGVPAEIDGRVEVQEKMGTIRSTRDAYLMVYFDGDNRTKPVHPTWNVTYFDEEGNVVWRDTETYV